MDTAMKLELFIDKQNWIPMKFGDVAFEPKENTKDPINDGIQHVVGLEHIESNEVHLRKSSSLESTTTFSKKFAVGDVLFGRRRAYLKKAALASFNGICSGDITVFRANNEVLLPELLPFIVQNEKFFDYAVKHSAGGLSPRVKFKDLANYEFLLPPKDQQAELAELLWAKQNAINSLVNLNQKISQTINSLEKHLFDKKLFDRTKLYKYTKVMGGFAFSSKSFVNEGIPVIKIKNLVNGEIQVNTGKNFIAKSIDQRLEKYIVSTDDILIAMTGATLGKVSIVQENYDGSYLNQRVGIFKQLDPSMKWLFYGLFNSKYFLHELNKFIGEGAQGNISSEDIEKTSFPLLKEKLSKQYNSNFSSLYSVLYSVEEKIKNSKALQKSIINQIF